MKATDIMISVQDYLKPENTLIEAVNLLRTATRGEGKAGVMGMSEECQFWTKMERWSA